ncbi:MAG: biosynthetic-type acetolactate synthase large subunit [Oscillospiraceae bacterium]|jgi:acetolactate synthase-1/2/3 large subunit|nr:biosynthetic-type acetolactate synthase large subunit [Oscillospiraceae bacterium]MCI1989779.1 biosynthetic-type acetolactate synthase large subunit [Oscillospiraceae bacterium]MCI2034382.1 biosynthetic-type acetolactate synthase large subunit [Oscillospiraceae bacterium]
MLLTGAQIVMECLLEQGVDTVFGYPGGAVLNLYDALYEYRDRIRHIRTCHEQAAAHAADGYARASGRTGVCIATSGPGATNLVTGIATAYMDSVPVVAITGNVTRDLLGLDSFQEVDITGITMPVTKHNYLVKHVERLADTLRSAFRIAGSGRKGPVLVDIPKDITALKTEFTPRRPEPFPAADLPPDGQLSRALAMLRSSKRPFFYCGGGVVSGGAAREAAEFAEKADAPVSCSLMCQGGYDQSGGRYLGMLGMHGTKASAEAIKNCDLLVAAGTRFSDRVLCNAGLFARHCKILQIDIDAAEFGKNIDVDWKLQGDVKSILARLNGLLPQQDHAGWMKQAAGWKRDFPLRQAGGPDEVTPQAVLETLSRLTGGGAVLTTEVGQHQMWAAQYYTFRKPRHFITSGGLGTMGFGLGAAIGAKTAEPEETVVNCAGDGSFHMNCAELSTLARYSIPVVELIFDNRTLGMVRQWQKLFYGGRFSQTDVDGNTDYAKLAGAFGVKALKIAKKHEIEPVLREALSSRGPVLIDCLISKDENVLPMVPAGGSVEDPILEM